MMPAGATGRGGAAAPIAILTDFGYRDPYVGAMKGVIASIAPGAPLIDITHGVPPQSIAAGAIALAQTWRAFPPPAGLPVVGHPRVGPAPLPRGVRAPAVGRVLGRPHAGPSPA